MDDDDDFLRQVEELLPQHLYADDIVVTAVRPAGGRPWARAEAVFELADLSTPVHGQTGGSAYLPLDADWRYASGLEVPSDYAVRLANAVELAARRLFTPRAVDAPPTPQEVSERWPWLLERLALRGPVREVRAGEVVVEEDDATVTVLATPQEWARIATPLERYADDPQDFGYREDDETYLVFYEDALVWSIRPELPPVRAGGDRLRRLRAARARGETDIGWFAYRPIRPDSSDSR